MKKLLVSVVGVVVLAGLGWRWLGGGATDGGGRLLADRVWIDHLPKRDTDTIQIFAAVSDERKGIFNATSAWKGAYELFRFEPRGGDRLALTFPQTGEKKDLHYRAWQCGQGGFDFCLEISGANRGVTRYYSSRGWEIGADAAAGDPSERVARVLRTIVK